MVDVHRMGAPARSLVVRISPGEDVLAGIEEAIARESVRTAAVVSGIGTLRDCHLHMVQTTGYPPQEAHPTWQNTALELASVSGLILDGTPHLHTVVSDEGRAVAGHLEPGCVVLYLCEILLLVFDDTSIVRRADEHGVPQIASRSDDEPH